MALNVRTDYPYFAWIGSQFIAATGLAIFSHDAGTIFPVMLVSFLFSLPVFAIFNIAYFMCNGMHIRPVVFKICLSLALTAVTFLLFIVVNLPLELYFVYGLSIISTCLLLPVHRRDIEQD